MSVELIKAASIITHWELNRQKNERHVIALAGHMNEHGFDENYPLRVFVTANGDVHLAAGHHRLAAATLKGTIADPNNPDVQFSVDLVYPNLPLTEVWVDLRNGTLDDVVRVMQEDNFQHDPAVQSTVGLPLTREEKVQQCKQLLTFRSYYERPSKGDLESVFGMNRTTIDRWKKEVSCAMHMINDAVNRADGIKAKVAVLKEFGISKERLADMMSLIQSGEREVTRGGTTYTQKTRASEAKKEDIRSTAIRLFRETHDAVMKGIDAIVSGCPSQKRATVKRRLYAAFGLSHNANASKWPTQTVTTETETLAILKTELQTPSKSLWWEEFRRLHNVKKRAEELIALGAPYLCDEVGRVLHEAQHTETADFEALSQSDRLNNSELIGNHVLAVLKKEQDARKAEAGRKKQQAQLREVNLAVKGAESACRRLNQAFIASRVADKTNAGYREFLTAAVHMGGYSRKQLEVDMFLRAEHLTDAELAHRIRGIADKMTLDLGRAEPPSWLVALFPEPEPAPEPPTPIAPIQNPTLVHPNPAPAPAPPTPAVCVSEMNETLEEMESELEEIETRDLKVEASVLDDNMKRKIRDAANAIASVLPLDARAMPSAVAAFDDELRRLCPDMLMRIDVLRSLLLRTVAKGEDK